MAIVRALKRIAVGTLSAGLVGAVASMLVFGSTGWFKGGEIWMAALLCGFVSSVGYALLRRTTPGSQVTEREKPMRSFRFYG
jgi:hypothetical protein